MNAKPNAVSLCKLFFCILGAMVFSRSSAWATSGAAVQAFNGGVKAFNAKQFNEAIPLFDDAISADPDFAEAYFARGACKYYLKSLDGALLDLNDALRLKPDYIDARALRGAINYEADHWDEALEDFNAVLAVHPQDAQSLLGRAVIELKREKFSAAARDFKGFLRARPDDPLAPKVRQLLASLNHAQESSPPPESEGEAPASRTPGDYSSSTPHRSTASSRAMSTEEMQKLADSLLGNTMVNSYNRKVLRGENAQAVGDIHAATGIPDEHKAPDTDVQIVEPQ